MSIVIEIVLQLRNTLGIGRYDDVTCIRTRTYSVVGWRHRLVIVTIPVFTSRSLKMTATGALRGNHLPVELPPPVFDDAPPSVLKLLVSNRVGGALIGKAGATINQIRAQSNAEVKMQDDSVRVLNTYARCDVSSVDQQAISSAALQVRGQTTQNY